jgi:hypothetical protein
MDSSKVAKLIEFWGTMVNEFYDPHESIDISLVFLFSPWSWFDCANAIVTYMFEDDTSCLVLKV